MGVVIKVTNNIFRLLCDIERNEKDSHPLMHAEISIKKMILRRQTQIVKMEKPEGGCDYSLLLWDRRNTGASPKYVLQSTACPPTLNHRRVSWETANPVTVEGCGAGAYQCVSRTAAAILPRHCPLSELGSPEALSLLTSAADISRHDSGHISPWLIAKTYFRQRPQQDLCLQHRGRTHAETQQNYSTVGIKLYYLLYSYKKAEPKYN